MIGTDAMAIAILAGGAGSRIGGGKPLAMLGGVTLIDRAFGLAGRWHGEAVAVVRSAGQLDMAHPMILDAPGIDGPLAGLAAGLEWAASRGKAAVLTIPCDMPFVPDDLPLRLGRSIGDRNAALASSGGILHPVCGLWRAAALAELEAYRATGRQSLKGFAAAIGFVVVDWPAEPRDPFFNVNSRDDLARAERLAGQLEGQQLDAFASRGGRGPGAPPDQQV